MDQIDDFRFLAYQREKMVKKQIKRVLSLRESHRRYLKRQLGRKAYQEYLQRWTRTEPVDHRLD